MSWKKKKKIKFWKCGWNAPPRALNYGIYPMNLQICNNLIPIKIMLLFFFLMKINNWFAYKLLIKNIGGLTDSTTKFFQIQNSRNERWKLILFLEGKRSQKKLKREGKKESEVGNGDEKKLAGLNMALYYSNQQSLLKSY